MLYARHILWDEFVNHERIETGLLGPLRLQVQEFRKLTGKEPDPALVQLDAAGLKVLFSRGIRRFGAQNSKTRDACLNCLLRLGCCAQKSSMVGQQGHVFQVHQLCD